MKFDKVLKFLVPKDDAYFHLFEGEANCIIRASKLLNELVFLTKDDERKNIFDQIKKIEHEGDEYTHKVYKELNVSFLTPFDREDIHALASSLDDVLDYIWAVTQRIQWYNHKPKKVHEEFKKFVDIINEMSKEIDKAVKGLRKLNKNHDDILEACINLNNLENKADEVFFSYMSQLFENKADEYMLEIIKGKDIFQTLEKCTDAAEDVSDIIKTILIKNV